MNYQVRSSYSKQQGMHYKAELYPQKFIY